MQDFLIYNLGFMLGASKRLDHKKSCREQCASLVRFIRSNGLSREPIEWDEEFPPDDFILRSSQLTEEGVMVMREGLRKWQAAQDRGRPKDDWKILEKALQAIRNQ